MRAVTWEDGVGDQSDSGPGVLVGCLRDGRRPPMRLPCRPFMLAVLSAACASCSGQSTQPPRLDTAPTDLVESTLKSMIDAAMDDAARRTKLERSRLEVVSTERVTWSDGSLGCPQPDMMYTQALVPGYRIRIKAGAEMLDYHSGRRGTPVLCPASRSIEPAADGPT